MEPFRSVRGGGARAWLAAAEASLLRSLVGQIMSLVEPEDPADEPAEGPADDRDAELAALEAMVHGPGADKIPEDPVLARLLPDGYRDDPEAAGEFRRYTEPALRSAKHAGRPGDAGHAAGRGRPHPADPGPGPVVAQGAERRPARARGPARRHRGVRGAVGRG